MMQEAVDRLAVAGLDTSGFHADARHPAGTRDKVHHDFRGNHSGCPLVGGGVGKHTASECHRCHAKLLLPLSTP